jgi:hypothetical protein
MDAWFIYYYCLQALYAPAMEALLGALASPGRSLIKKLSEKTKQKSFFKTYNHKDLVKDFNKKFDKKFIRKNETKKFFLKNIITKIL